MFHIVSQASQSHNDSLDARFLSRLTGKLILAEPAGLKTWFDRVMETTFHGSSKTKPNFELEFIEMNKGSVWCSNPEGFSRSGEAAHPGASRPPLRRRSRFAW